MKWKKAVCLEIYREQPFCFHLPTLGLSRPIQFNPIYSKRLTGSKHKISFTLQNSTTKDINLGWKKRIISKFTRLKWNKRHRAITGKWDLGILFNIWHNVLYYPQFGLNEIERDEGNCVFFFFFFWSLKQPQHWNNWYKTYHFSHGPLIIFS